MIDKLIELSIMSGGLLPLMGVLLLITLAVIVERSYFFFKVLKSGHAMEHDLQLVEYQNWEKLEKILTDERIFDERRKHAVAHQFFPAVGGFGALRENFDNQNRVFDFSRRHIHHFAFVRTTNEQVGIVIRFCLRDANPHIVHERSARRVAQMCVQSSDQIYGNHIVPQRSASHRKDFAAHVLVPHRAARFQAQVFFLRDRAVFLNEHSRTPNFNSSYCATCGELLVGKRVTADEP